MAPIITVVIPTHRPDKLDRLLDSIRDTDYPKNNLEVLVVEGNNPSKQRNDAIRISNGDIVYFLDDDVTIERDLFRRAAEYYTDDSVTGVGGPNINPTTSSYLQKCFSYIMESFFGSATMRYRYRPIKPISKASEKHLILCNLSIRKNVLEKENAFNESLYPNEENELIDRLTFRGYRFVYDPEVRAYHERRNTIRKFSQQIFNHGRGRMGQILIQNSPISLLFFLPSLFTLYLLYVPFSHNTLYLIPLVVYIIADLVSSISIAIAKKDLKLILILPLLYPIEHISYSMGFIWGFFRKILHLRKDKEIVVKITKIDLSKV